MLVAVLLLGIASAFCVHGNGSSGEWPAGEMDVHGAVTGSWIGVASVTRGIRLGVPLVLVFSRCVWCRLDFGDPKKKYLFGFLCASPWREGELDDPRLSLPVLYSSSLEESTSSLLVTLLWLLCPP